MLCGLEGSSRSETRVPWSCIFRTIAYFRRPRTSTATACLYQRELFDLGEKLVIPTGLEGVGGGHGSALHQCPDDLAPARRRLVATPGCCEPVNEQEAASALVIGARLGWGGQPEVLTPHLNERRLPISREPEMDAGQAGICGVAGAFVLVHRRPYGLGNELGHDHVHAVGQF